MNTETYKHQEIKDMNNYYRFSFPIDELPRTFWKHYIDKDNNYLKFDSIRVIITGRTSNLGGYFKASKEYKIQDIEIDLKNPEDRFKKSYKTLFRKDKIKIDWKEFIKSSRSSEKERQNVINEIQDYIDNQK